MNPPDKTDRPRAAIWLGFILMCLGMFMAILDIQVVATSLPAIQKALDISRDTMSWIQTAYLIAEITAIPLTGWSCPKIQSDASHEACSTTSSG